MCPVDPRGWIDHADPYHGEMGGALHTTARSHARQTANAALDLTLSRPMYVPCNPAMPLLHDEMTRMELWSGGQDWRTLIWNCEQVWSE